MSEKQEIFSSQIKSTGIFNFAEFYKFCHTYLTEEFGLLVFEKKYKEKLKGDLKEHEIKWTGVQEVTDYFKFEVKIDMTTEKLAQVEIKQGDAKIKTNSGAVKMKVKGNLIRDYKGKFDTSAFRKILRSIYDRFVIPSRIEQFELKLIGDCDEFLGQAKAFLDLEGKR